VRISGQDRARAAGIELAARAEPFAPEAVLGILEGGAAVARAMAEALGVPMHGLDLRYGWSRRLARLPAPLRLGLWPLKEISYRSFAPRFSDGSIERLPRIGRAVLVDDSASSGRTLEAAIEALGRRGLGRSSLFVAAIRCGRRSRRLLDAWITDRALW
jgi:hypoxanthine phosphoribosyltransferase